jgi:hypothetical protein
MTDPHIEGVQFRMYMVITPRRAGKLVHTEHFVAHVDGNIPLSTNQLLSPYTRKDGDFIKSPVTS